jgi:protein-S-isoprenylcysteine O-methyltransferase Ste14
MKTRRLVLIINYVVLLASCSYGHNSLHVGPWLKEIISVFGLLLALVCILLAVVIHRSFPKKHEKASDFPELMTTGPYGHVRHPLYSLLIVLNYAISLMFMSIHAIVASTLLLPVWWFLAKTEENELVCLWGSKYREYRKRVPMFLPIRRRKHAR